MKNTFFMLNIIACITMACNAMEDESSLDRVQPECAQYITNKKIVVGHKKGCDIFNVKTNKKIIQISDLPCHAVAVHPDRTKIVFAGYNNQYKTIGLYNRKTGMQEWLKSKKNDAGNECVIFAHSICFNQSNDTISYYLSDLLHGYVVRKRNYAGELFDILHDTAATHMALCAEQQALCVVKNDCSCVVYNSSDLSEGPKKIATELFINEEFSDHCCMSSEGNVAFLRLDGNVTTLVKSIQDGAVIESKGQLNKAENEMFHYVYFYSKDSIVVTISSFFDEDKTVRKREYKIRYWDIKTGKVIHTTDLSGLYSGLQDYSFSPNLKNMLLSFKTEWMKIPIPWQVVYQDKTKEFFPYSLFLLKEHISELKLGNVPLDVIKLLSKALLKAFRR